MRNKNNPVVVGSLCALASEVLYGLSYMFTKQATDLASPFALLGWRFLIAVLVMHGLCALKRINLNLKRKTIKPLLVISLFSPCLYFIAETLGISRTTSSESGIFLACIPVATLIASTLILKKRPSKRELTGILITLFGVALTVLSAGIRTGASSVGYGFLVLAVAAYALYSVFVEKASGYTELEITYGMLLSGSVFFTALAIIEASFRGGVGDLVTLPFRMPGFLVAVLYQGIGCSIGAFFLANKAITTLGVNRTATFIGLGTVTSIVSGVLILKEPLSALQLIGAMVILLGVYVANGRIIE